METAAWYEVVGYVGSGLVVVSLMMRSVLRLRVINLLGALIFTIYGVLIDAWPVVGLNVAIVVIDAWHLRGMLPRRPEHFDVVQVPPGSPFLARFLHYHRDEIQRFVPSWRHVRDDHRVFLVLRNAVPAGVVVLRQMGTAAVHVELDYVVPEQRDFRLGSWVYEHSGIFRAHGWMRVTADPGNATHRHYLERMGFEPAGREMLMELR
ncbi:MAG: hypothetical protein KY461_00480 [Actinobacteria bacterium]|nr:hypothetical protein [Actinomycetota bacterium]